MAPTTTLLLLTRIETALNNRPSVMATAYLQAIKAGSSARAILQELREQCTDIRSRGGMVELLGEALVFELVNHLSVVDGKLRVFSPKS